MGKYSVEIISKAEKEFMKLSETVREKLRKQILSLEGTHAPSDIRNSKKRNTIE